MDLPEIFYKDMRRPSLDLTLTPYEAEHVKIIAKRASEIYRRMGCGRYRKNIEFDLAACHKYGCRLVLYRLSKATDYDLVQDVSGICIYLDRTTGELKGFMPKYAYAQAVASKIKWNAKEQRYILSPKWDDKEQRYV